jgi:CrcB protein
VLDFLVISLGAIAGANSRYLLSRYAIERWGAQFPYGTLIINVLGSLVVGFFVTWTTEDVAINPRWRLLVVVGFCGAFTTFSSYAHESMAMFERGEWFLPVVNILSSNLLCLAAALGGIVLARAI